MLELASALGVEVYDMDLPDEKTKGINGVIEYSENDDQVKARIFINKNYNKERKTFTLAHELGHYLLHPHDSSKYRLDTFDYTENIPEAIQETEANYFAASLLVPAQKLKQLLELTADLETIAKYFGVSVPVVQNRIKWLKTN